MQEISAGQLDDLGLPFWRYHLAVEPLLGAWRDGDALALELGPRTDGRWPVARQYVALGPSDRLGPLLAALAERRPPPDRLTLEDVGVPSPWPQEPVGRWTWMWSATPPPAPGVPVREVRDHVRLDALLDVANPASWARPDDGRAEVWLGIEHDGDLVAAGCVIRTRAGVGHLQGVVVHPDHRGRGLGRAVSAGLTRRAQSSGPGVATLGVYAANAAALGTYGSLGFAAPHTFRSGPVARPAAQDRSRLITRASDPSG